MHSFLYLTQLEDYRLGFLGGLLTQILATGSRRLILMNHPLVQPRSVAAAVEDLMKVLGETTLHEHNAKPLLAL